MSYRGRGRGGFHNNGSSYGNAHNSMEIESGNSYNRNNNYNRNGPVDHQQQQQKINSFIQKNAVEVEIRGWENASKEDLLSFLSRKCRVTVMDAIVDGQVVRGTVRSQKDAQTLSNWSGVRFANNSLKISIVSSSNSPAEGANTIDLLKTFLKIRYNADLKLLNLSNFQSDPVLVSKGLFATVSTSSKMFPALMKIATNINYQVETVDLSNNNLNDISGITTLAQTFPKLKNLSLQNNNISKPKSFESWKHKLSYLRELVLLDNPIVNDPTFASEMLRIFPRLIILNGEYIRNESTLSEFLKFPSITKQFFFEDSEIQSIATNFISNYIKLWDSNRLDLLSLYSQESQVSIQVDASHPHNTVTNNVESPYTYYLGNSRNLTKISNPKMRMSKIFKGPESISKLFQSLPKTKHALLEAPEKFSMEAWRFPQVGGIIVVLHGEFDEIDHPITPASSNNSANTRRYAANRRPASKSSLTPKSFDRTFVIVPGNSGSMVVASDLFCLKLIASPEAWAEKSQVELSAPQPQAQPTPAAAPTAVPGGFDIPIEIKAKLLPLQQEILLKIIMETKLNLEFAGILCEQSNWDYDACITNFKNSANSIPPHAFQH